MARSRLLLSLPLAVLVAVLAHALCFGTGHLPGGDEAAGLLGTLGAGLALAAVVGLLLAALRPTGERFAEARSDGFPILVGAGGLAAFALIELCEGHAPLAAGWPAALAIVAATIAVWFAARAATRVLAASGRVLGALMQTRRCGSSAGVLTSALRTILLPARRERSGARGRAPPSLVAGTL